MVAMLVAAEKFNKFVFYDTFYHIVWDYYAKRDMKLGNTGAGCAPVLHGGGMQRHLSGCEHPSH